MRTLVAAAILGLGIYRKKTFDPENQNQVDNETILIFQKDATGKLKVTQVIFG